MLRALLERFRKPRYYVLGDRVRADVILDGAVVGTVFDRRVTDMFWASYQVEPAGASEAIFDDELWSQCRFAFRDPATGAVCTSAFPGGKAPFIRDGRVLLRAMYFPR